MSECYNYPHLSELYYKLEIYEVSLSKFCIVSISNKKQQKEKNITFTEISLEWRGGPLPWEKAHVSLEKGREDLEKGREDLEKGREDLASVFIILETNRKYPYYVQ